MAIFSSHWHLLRYENLTILYFCVTVLMDKPIGGCIILNLHIMNCLKYKMYILHMLFMKIVTPLSVNMSVSVLLLINIRLFKKFCIYYHILQSVKSSHYISLFILGYLFVVGISPDLVFRYYTSNFAVYVPSPFINCWQSWFMDTK